MAHLRALPPTIALFAAQMLPLFAEPIAYLKAPKDGPALELPAWPPREHVLLYLSFDEDKGQVASSPGTWGRALLGSKPEPEPSDPQWAQGLRGGAVRFDGQDDFLTVPGVNQVRLNAFTFEAWIKPVGTSREIILDYGGTSWGFAFSKAWHGAYVAIGHKPRGTRVSAPQFSVSLGHWNHLAATYDGREVRIYVNGRPVAHQTVPPPMERGNRGWPLIIGKIRSNHYYLTGLLDELLVLDTARTPDEVFLDMIASMQPARKE